MTIAYRVNRVKMWLGFRKRNIGIRLHYYKRITAIKFNMHQRLIRLTIAGWLTHLAFKISSDAEDAIRTHIYMKLRDFDLE